MTVKKYNNNPLLICVIGPTASGKSALAIKLAQELGGEIVNCDSMQMVRELEIGTAKPGLSEKAACPHHLFDLVSVSEVYSAGQYMIQARKICSEITSRGRVPIVTGGTGLYLRALLQGMFDGPSREEAIRQRLKTISTKKGTAFLHKWLSSRDPRAAGQIKPSDEVRLIRALEVRIVTGSTISSMRGQEEALSGYRIIKIGLNPDRQFLYDRINRRVVKMFDAGLLNETRNLLEMGYDASCKGFDALGYKYAIQVLKGAMEESRAIELTQRDSRRYAKRQMTWFRREPGVRWIIGTGETEESYRDALWIVENS